MSMKYWLPATLLFLTLFWSVGYIPVARSQGPSTPGNEFTKGIEAAKDLATGAGLSDKTDIIAVIATIIKFLLALSAVLAMGAIVWGGIMYIMSLGDEGRAGKAKTIIWYAIIGVIVVLISYVIIAFIQAQLTASNPFGVTTVWAQAGTATDKGFTSGIDAIKDLIKPEESGLATGTDIIPIILRVVNFLLGLVAVLALAALVWGAIMYILSLGDESRAEKGKKIILYAIIGVLLAGMSFLLLRVVQTIIFG